MSDFVPLAQPACLGKPAPAASRPRDAPALGDGILDMGLFWRLFAPKPLKKARRTVRKAANPVHTATRAVTPKPGKQLQRAAHAASMAELKIEDAVVDALRSKHGQKRSRRAAQSLPK